VRNGRQMSRAEITRPGIGPDNYFFGYDRFLKNWEQVFGAANIRLIPFRRQPDITAFMIGELAIDMTALPPPVRENAALDWRAIALGNVMNRSLAAAGLPQRTNYFLDDMPGSERIQPGRALGQELQARFAQSNAALAARRPDITLADLTPDWSAYAEDGNLHLIDAPCVFEPQLGHIVQRYACELALERWRRHIAEGKLAALTGDEAALRRAQRQAQDAARDLRGLGAALPDASGGA